MGGVGGILLITLARMGLGKFRISDADEIEVKNFNRQFGATVENLGLAKAQVMESAARSINPELEVDVLSDFVNPQNIDEFLNEVAILCAAA
jgi:tRNA A37 threonylcarbamoyladenosine dehydratase